MPEHDTRDSEAPAPASSAPATPRVSGEVTAGLGSSDTPHPASSTRAAQLPLEPSAVSQPGDTLLSAGKPADRQEMPFEDRFSVLDERLRQLDARLLALEQKKSIAVPEARQKPWLWIAFLIALVVVFQLLRLMR